MRHVERFLEMRPCLCKISARLRKLARNDEWLDEGAGSPSMASVLDGLSHPFRGGIQFRSPGAERSMAQTDQAWDWGVELRDEERSELELLRRTVAQLRTELDQAHESLRSCRQRQQDARQALRQLDEARLWRRRRVRTALRERQLL